MGSFFSSFIWIFVWVVVKDDHLQQGAGATCTDDWIPAFARHHAQRMPNCVLDVLIADTVGTVGTVD